MTDECEYIENIKPLIMYKSQFNKQQKIIIYKIKNFTMNLFNQSNQRKPKVIIINHNDINASICFSPLIIFIHKGCIKRLKYNQLQGMIAHELGHLLIKKYHISSNSLEAEVRADDIACKIYKLHPLLSFLTRSKEDFLKLHHQKYINYAFGGM